MALGTSVACQDDADANIPPLLETPAALRFVSYEPGIEEVDFRGQWQPEGCHIDWLCPNDWLDPPVPALDVIIIGGESGSKARPFDIAWARSTIAQCEAAGVVAMVKQLGAKPTFALRGDNAEWLAGGQKGLWKVQSRDGSSFWRDSNGLRQGFFVGLRHSHGGDPAEWPEDLRPYAASVDRWPWA